MSEVFHFSARNCLEWSVEKPFCDGVKRKSPKFSHLENEWYLLISAADYAEKTEYTFQLINATNKFGRRGDKDAKLTVLIYSVSMQWSKYVGTLHLQKNKRTDPAASIQFSKDDLYGHWRVYIIFSSDFPTELHIKEKERKNLVSNLPGSSNMEMKSMLAASVAEDSLSDEEIMSTDFGKLLEQQSTSDVTLTCGGRTFSAHRLILAARSEVFTTMFQNKMVESETGSIDIKDIDDDVLDLLLKYVYTGKIFDLSVDIASRLYIAADKYSIQSLKNKCLKWMLQSLTSENCLDFLAIADTFNDEMFKDKLINFSAEILHLLEGDKWQKFSDKYPKLALSVYQKRVFSKPVE